jgi:glycosyltransferase involved in cell wall biosynthesis
MASNYPEIGIIVIDDASTDDTCTRVQNFGLSNLRLIQLENHGVAGALNAGILEAGTEFIAFLDADDEWLDGKLIKQLPIINTHPEMTFIACGGEDVDPAGLVHHTFGLEPPPSAGEFWRALLCKAYFPRTTVVARRSALIKAGGFDEGLMVSEDQDMWIRLAAAAETGFLTEILVRYHHQLGSLAQRYWRREAVFTLSMIRKNLAQFAHRLSKREIKHVLGHRYAALGRNMYGSGAIGRGAALVIRGMLLGNRPLENLGYLIAAAPPAIYLKRHFRKMD